ncbi:ATP-dependent zinc protease [Candidatus Saccharibacteria bacterium]|nr:ATP-dependent zinc protease [Candidatus Saccharibacteria bacterium]
MKDFQIIGRAERVNLPELGLKGVPAKVDTGADASSIWATGLEVSDNGLEVVFFGPDSPYYSGEKVQFPPGTYTFTRVASSFGQREVRYKVKLRVKVAGRVIYATFTLANRSSKTYPILIGRKLLHGKFIVDVSKGNPLIGEERKKRAIMKKELGLS